MKRLGAHVSASGGVSNAPLNAKKIDAKAFALFTKNQRRWKSKPLTEKEIKKFKTNLKENDFDPKYIMPHDSYLINLGNPDELKREKSLNALIDEINRADQLGLKLLNIHPGNHLKKISEEQCLDYISDNINIALEKTKNVTIVVENVSGQGTSVGYNFEHIRRIINNVKNKDRIGVCLDTCHMFGAGYDIRTKESYEKVMTEFDDIIGFEYLRGMHLNDSKKKLGSKKDRHHSIGKGLIGEDAFKFIMNDPRIDDLPLILETIDSSIWKEEIKKLYSFVK
ncbi:MAG: deoxyribonuclease IV [Fusobacteriota bacterium]